MNVSSLGRERILTLLPASYNQLQGYIPMVSHALMAACAETHPPLQLIAAHETFNKVNQQPLIHEYTDQDPTYAPSHLLDENRLKQLGSMLGVRYLLQPGFAYVTEDTEEKFEFGGFVFVRTRVNSIGLWFRLWDAQTGEFLVESNGEAIVAAGLFREGSAVPLHETTRRLWKEMLQKSVFGGETK
jgi:hypothetical protein